MFEAYPKFQGIETTGDLGLSSEPNSCLLLWSKRSGRTTVHWSKQGWQFGLNENHAVTWRPGWWSEQCHQHAPAGSANDTCGMGVVSRKRRVWSWDGVPTGFCLGVIRTKLELILILCSSLNLNLSDWKPTAFPSHFVASSALEMSFWLVATSFLPRDVSCFP